MSQKPPADREEQELAISNARAYTAPGVTVFYDTGRCVHFAECVRGLPQVFDVEKRLLSQMVKEGQAKNLSRGQYVRPNYENIPDNADNLTKGKGNISLSGTSGHSGKDGAQEKP